jgi:hypothetical protein
MITRNQDGEIVFSADETDELVGALKEIVATAEVGKLYKRDFYSKERADDDCDKLVAAAQQIAGGPNISSRHLTHALTLLIDSGELQPRNAVQAEQLEEPEQDLRPRDRNGKLLTEAQISWGEMSRFAATATADQVRQRKNVDGKFREFIQTNLRREMAEQPVGDGVTPAGQPTTKARASQELVDFTSKYNREPIANLKPKGGFVTLGGEQMPWSTFNDLLNKATAARLL